ncbi:O-antigen ligase family protein [Desulfurivibrio alkaliphilus]|uniref:O-antigen polymerase n=1 Tax=Desulfurivibrio alkaliphilus (strain DSM 19089 / UNIQEM U267 / AHT2) TaxID=589865 RepID=D6Z2L7_DESAT|nr:O-antigen ligase family protein [Desulfurivibrio alkaliphilus]ADH85792.1 O-antigen polymerase [Desulfurivibrio alkaliphilus AHT 2]
MSGVLPRWPTWLAMPEGRLQTWAVIALYAMALVSPHSTSLGQAAQGGVFVVALVFIVRHFSALRRSPMFWLGVAFLAYVVLRGVVGWLGDPEMGAEYLDGARGWGKSLVTPVLLTGIVLVATGNWLKHGLGVVAVLFASLLLDVLLTLDGGAFIQALQTNRRYVFDLGHLIAGLKLGAALLAVLIFVPLLAVRSQTSGHATDDLSSRPVGAVGFGARLGIVRPWRLAAWLLVLLLAGGVLLAALLATKTRTGWFAVAAALPVVLLLATWHFRSQLLARNAVALVPAIVAGLALLLTVAFGWGILESRVSSQWQTMGELVTLPQGGNIEEISDSSLGVRAAYAHFALERVLERPWFGFGPAEPYYLLQKRPIPWQLEGRTGHFHNGHLEIMVRFGVVGYMLVLAFVSLMLHEGWRRLAEPNDGRARALALFGIGFIVFMAVWMLGTHNLDRFVLIHFYSLLTAPLVAAHLSRYCPNSVKSLARG